MWAWVGSSLLVGAAVQGSEVERRVEECVARLASAVPEERDRAGAEILELGLDALEPLERLRDHEEPETCARVQDLLRQLRGVEGEVYGEPSVVALPGGATTSWQTIQRLCEQASWPLQLVPRATGRTAEVEPRSLPFFEAVDEVARAAGFRVEYHLSPPATEATSSSRVVRQPRIELLERRGEDLPVAYAGPVRIAVESVEQERSWGGGGERWEVRVFYSVAWQPNVQPLKVENVVESAQLGAGEAPAVREADRRGEDGSRCVVLEGRAGGERLRLRGRVRIHVSEVVARGPVAADVAEGAEVRLGAHAFTVRRVEEADELRTLRLVPARRGLLDSAEIVLAGVGEWGAGWMRAGPAERVASPDGGYEIKLTLARGLAASVEVHVVLRSRAIDHPYEWDLPFPAFWPGSE